MTPRATQSTQRAKILQLLIDARGGWVPLPRIAECAVQYGARIYELRRLGFRITNKTHEVDGERHSWFSLESGPAVVSKLEQKENIPHSSESLFGGLGLESRYPD